MKTKMLGLVTLFMFAAVMVFAQDTNLKTEEFEVKGNGEMCKERIEKAAESVEGVSSADWDMETKVLTVEFDQNVTTKDDIEVAISEAGHDTPNYKAPDNVYEELPENSKYRKEGELKNEPNVEEEIEEEIKME